MPPAEKSCIINSGGGVMNYVGIDLHKRSTYVSVMKEDGELIIQRRVATEPEELKLLMDKIPKPFCATLEATRNWYWVYDLVEESAQEVKLAHPPKTRLIAEAKIKTDKVDSKILADLLRTDYLPTCYVPDRETRQVRELLRYRAYLIRIRNGLKSRIHCILDKCGIVHPYEDLFSKRGIEFLKSLKLDWAYQMQLKDFLELIEILKKKEKEQNKIIEEICKKNKDAELLLSLPGIGYHNALLILSEIGDVNRFPDGAHFASYCGLVTSVYISDKTVHYGHITKQGSSWLRWIYIEAAHFARRYSIRFSKLYNRVKNKVGPQKATVAVARELAVVSYYLLKKKNKFKDYTW